MGTKRLVYMGRLACCSCHAAFNRPSSSACVSGSSDKTIRKSCSRLANLSLVLHLEPSARLTQPDQFRGLCGASTGQILSATAFRQQLLSGGSRVRRHTCNAQLARHGAEKVGAAVLGGQILVERYEHAGQLIWKNSWHATLPDPQGRMHKLMHVHVRELQLDTRVRLRSMCSVGPTCIRQDFLPVF